MSAGEKVAVKEAEHVIAKAVEKAGVRDAEKIAAKDAEKTAVKRGAKKTLAEDLYRRPEKFRGGVRDTVWNSAKDTRGSVRDPVTGRYMGKSSPWDMGHREGYEFRKHADSARERGITRKQFLDEHNDPTHYRPELPSSNRGHRGELHTDDYFGP
jgi:predicted ribonuclease toxin of YeeF-YezG toxin-antitoxin module